MQNSISVKKFIKENFELFWYIKPESRENISEKFLVETILNYGDYQAVKKLFDLLGKEKVSRIFFEQSGKARHNYLKLVKHYFTLYFNRNV